MRRGQQKVREFALYGESAAQGGDPHLHIEDIASRAQRYDWEIAPHRHGSLCQVLFIARGHADIHVDDANASLEGPAIAMIPPGTVHGFEFRERTHGYVLTVPAERIPVGAEREMRDLLQAVFTEPFVGAIQDAALAARLEHLFDRLHAEFREPDSDTAPVAGWIASSVLWILARHVAHARRSGRAPTRQRAWLKFRALAESHFHEQWKVTRYARELGMTTARLNRLCREQHGQSASRVLQQRLALEARRRLIYVDIPIARLAIELGFRDAAYFCRFFKRNTGASPRAFRRNAMVQRMGLSSATA